MQYIETGRGIGTFAFLVILLFNPIASLSVEKELLNVIQSDIKYQPQDKDSRNDKQPIYIKVVTPEKPTEGLKSFDVATITLAAATVVLTGVGVILAIAAIWGYKEIKATLINVAESKAEAVAKDKAEVVAARAIADWIKSLETNEEKAETEAIVKSADDGDGEYKYE